MKQFEPRKTILNVSRRGTSTECEMIVAPRAQKQASESDYKNLSLFTEECCRNLKQCVERLYAKFPRLTSCIFELEIRKGQRFIKVSIEISDVIGFKKVVKGRKSIDLVQSLVDGFSVKDLDFKSLSTGGGVEDFKKNWICPALLRYKDVCDVERVEVITADRIVWHAREFMKPRFTSRHRCLLVIVLVSGERIHTNLKQLKKSQKKYLRQLNPVHQQYCDLMRTDRVLLAYPLSKLQLQRTDTKHARSQAHAVYTNGFSHHITTIGNRPKSDYPMFVFDKRHSGPNSVDKATHEFFYLWSASLHDQINERVFLLIYKFGVTSIACDEGKFDVALMESAVRSRARGYTRDHDMHTNDLRVELMSRPESICLTSERLGLQFETWLKNKDNNKLLLKYINESNDLHATELMISDHFNDIDALKYVVAMAKEHFPALEFF